ncbi:hypothetical protein GCM10009717_29910 [Agromyces allii]|uniref:Uncharacterized protein n=1 Tax=Agromyces allii TaxID=393607 RepID=A0ABN2R023_9MICO
MRRSQAVFFLGEAHLSGCRGSRDRAIPGLYRGGPAHQNGTTISKECAMSTEAVIWSVLGVIAAVGGIGLLASILALIRAPR